MSTSAARVTTTELQQAILIEFVHLTEKGISNVVQRPCVFLLAFPILTNVQILTEVKLDLDLDQVGRLRRRMQTACDSLI